MATPIRWCGRLAATYNRIEGYRPAIPHYLETPWPNRMMRRAHARRLLETADAYKRVLTGQVRRGRCSPVKLAIIHKA